MSRHLPRWGWERAWRLETMLVVNVVKQNSTRRRDLSQRSWPGATSIELALDSQRRDGTCAQVCSAWRP